MRAPEVNRFTSQDLMDAICFVRGQLRVLRAACRAPLDGGDEITVGLIEDSLVALLHELDDRVPPGVWTMVPENGTGSGAAAEAAS